MATIVLSAAGAAAGASIGGSVLGLSSVVLGRAVGATLGRVVDQRLLGAGAQPVETGRIDRLRLSGASEGSAVQSVFGRTRVGGQVIWASNFLESFSESGGGKGSSSSSPTVRSYSYSVSLALALCEGEILRIARVWADGEEIPVDDLNMRVYRGGEDQLPDPKIEAIEGADKAPAYRGLAYVVIEDLQLAPYGNRVPQLSFEVMRAVPSVDGAETLQDIVQGVALIPGMGEYGLATTPVHYSEGLGLKQSANVHSPGSRTDFDVSLDALNEELPNCGSTLLVASWFGDDLRCGLCQIRPKVEQKDFDGAEMPWRVAGLSRDQAEVVPQLDGDEVYGGTTADAAVLEGIAALKAAGKSITFYPFLVMEQLADNQLVNPWTGSEGQPHLPWRGRITTSLAQGLEGSPDGTAAAGAEVAAFFGNASVTDFQASSGTVQYTGPAEWSFRRFILHYAHLCVMAGGVDTFCIGSEMRGLTQIRGSGNNFPAVAALVQLAADVRSILGPDVKLTYAADWSEYFGYHPQDGSGDVFFHLDPLWSSDDIDFVGIDNYMPLSDWRDGRSHADAEAGSIYDLAYLQSNIEGGEGYDWYYASEEGAQAQRRLPIEDGAYSEPWIYRFKDIRNWWSRTHHDRVDGIRQEPATGWVPQSKPVVFVEYGCAAIDKGANQPNRFLDPKSSESGLPRGSNGRRDDYMQAQYLRALTGYWSAAENNPVSSSYGGPMIDLASSHVWAWDARPYPRFPANSKLWTDGGNYARGHWLNGRATAQPLAAVVKDICLRSGVSKVETGDLHGNVRGYSVFGTEDARSILQPLMLAHGFDAFEREGRLVFKSRNGHEDALVDPDFVVANQDGADLLKTRAAEAEMADRIALSFVEADGAYETRSAEAIFSDERNVSVSSSEVPMALTANEGRMTAERWLAEARIARDSLRFSLPLSQMDLGPGDILRLENDGASERYRIDSVEHCTAREIEATRVGHGNYDAVPWVEDTPSLAPFAPPLPVSFQFLDLPLFKDTQNPHAPHLAVTAHPWPGSVSVFSSDTDSGFTLNSVIETAAVIGQTETELYRAPAGLWDNGPGLRVKLAGGALSSAQMMSVLNGANAVAIGDGSADKWEVFQFAEADLIEAQTYVLRTRLRGQLGTEAAMRDVWPVGSLVVLLDSRVGQIDMPLDTRGLARNYRVGPSGRPVDDPSYGQVQLAFDGVGLRPYRPCHLRARLNPSGDIHTSWIRQTRIDGDSWQSTEVPLGEAQEAYLLRVLDAESKIVREATTSEPAFIYSAAQQAEDGNASGFRIAVAQISESFGPGPSAEIDAPV
ncbi:baseplate multidomain protein megatron [Actibacterium pelagium]|uniref:Phage host specificity protein n=1 Tax=Actibacterium pelagium TaxID=2029103 RepID=A0A917ABL3_9RHOB|nr:glycoside hydrolase TIM-barrel-like domain-containing protein [Actibacterium pelagium]GGE40640.1 phage host specificity protein [Actibacterium pelagium]